MFRYTGLHRFALEPDMDLEQFVLANEPALRLAFFLGVFAVIGLWEVVAPRRA